MKKIIVAGGGIAGLTTGIYARLAGYEAEIYEKNPVVGGECMGWNRNGYHIDNCIHWLTGTKPDTSLYNVWKTVGAIDENTKYGDITEFYTCELNGQTATLWHDLEKTRKELIQISPEDEEEINKFIEHVEYAKQCLIPSEKPMEMMGIKDYIDMGKEMADMPKVMKEYGKINLSQLADRFKNPLIKMLMSEYMPKEYVAYSFLVSYATMASGNGNVPLGGSLAMSLRMRDKFVSLGGKVFTGKAVEEIIIENGTATGIKLEDGSIHKADYIIPTVDFNVLFNKLVDKKYMPAELKDAYADEKAYPVTSGFQAAFTVKGSMPIRGTVLFPCDEFRMGNKTYDRLSYKVYDYDELFKKDGKTVIQVHIVQDHEDYYFWKGLSAEEYKTKKAEYAEMMKEQLEKRFPELKGNLELLDVWTPLTYERYCGAYHGAYMSFVTTTGGKAFRTKGTVKGIKNMYLAGQWTMAPGGLPVAAVSGKFAVQRILKSEHKDIKVD